MHETDAELTELQGLLDASAASAGPHLASIATEERRLSAARLCGAMQGMCLLVVSTVSADGRPLGGPVDGYLLHGALYFSSSRDSVRMRHLAVRPAISATHLPSEQLAVTVHGTAELFDVLGPEHPELRAAMLEWYVPRQGDAFAEWLETSDSVGARIRASKMLTFHMDDA